MSDRSLSASESAGPAPELSLRARLAVWLTILTVASSSLYFFYSRGLNNLYGDAMAHMEGARRIFDSVTPGYSEIGTVWLPLCHLLASPLAINDFLWRTGLAGGLVSTAAFGVTAWLLFRLAWEMNRNGAAAGLALAGFLLCPNMLYLASTPLTEPVAILWSVLVAYCLFRFQVGGHIGALLAAAFAAFLGTLTRYDGWFLLPFAALFVLLARREYWQVRLRHTLIFSAIAGAGPVLWLLHNAYRYGNAWEFYNGRGSTQDQYAHQLATTAFRYPTDGSLLAAARYYLTDLDLVVGLWPLLLAMLGLVAWAADRRERPRRSAALLLLVPFPFYLHALAYAAVPLYVPTLFPHTYFNLRLGLEMLPAVALLPSFLLLPNFSRRLRSVLLAILLCVVVGQALSTAAHGAGELAVAKEGVTNTPCRSQKQQAVIHLLREKYDGQTILAAAGRWPCVMPQVMIPFRKTLSEANREYWTRLRSEPEKWVAWIIRSDGDTVDALMTAYPQAFANYDLIYQEMLPSEGRVRVYRRRATR
jgi:hypothetical protein